MKQIQLPRGYTALVDDGDFAFLSQFKWEVDVRKGQVYAKMYVEERANGVRIRRRVFYLHRYIMGATERAVFVDHRSGDSLDNRRGNLRICTQAENSRNKKQMPSKSGFKGVHPTPSGRWAAKLMLNYKSVSAGTYDTPEDAARAYDQKAVECFGQFARLNFP